MLHAYRARWLSPCGVYGVRREAADFVPVTEIPDCVHHLAPSWIERIVPTGHKPAIRIFCNDDERFRGKKRQASGSGAIVKLLDEIPVVNIGEVVDAETVDMVVRHPELRHLAQEFSGRKVAVVGRRVKQK